MAPIELTDLDRRIWEEEHDLFMGVPEREVNPRVRRGREALAEATHLA